MDFSPESGDKLRIAVTDDRVWKSVELPHLVKEEFGKLLRCDPGGSRNKPDHAGQLVNNYP
jgi:hypothetical protein